MNRKRRYRCPKCGSSEITPIEKRAQGRKTVCEFICEDCGHRFGPVVYAD